MGPRARALELLGERARGGSPSRAGRYASVSTRSWIPPLRAFKMARVFALGHLGIGKKIAARPYRRFSALEKRAFFLGALLPDLIDKPLFYIPFWLTGRRGDAAGILSGTHLFAHTGLFLLALVVAARITRSLPARAVAIGVATHFVLDVIGLSMGLGTLLWPLFGWHFPAYPFRNLGQHLSTILNPVTLTGELLGAAILWWDYRRARRQPDA